MKTPSILRLLPTALLASAGILQAQVPGPLLTPPGAPADGVFKTLVQVEPRTPIAAVPFTISQPGSYYLTNNVSVTTGDAISINADDVTLDLSGFTISSTASPASGTGILIGSGLKNITITNGHIRGSVTQSGGVYTGAGFDDGIHSPSNSPANARVSKISVSGCMDEGIYLVNNRRSSTVESCVVNTVGGVGIYADVVKDSSATQCKLSGIVGTIISNSKGQSFTSSAVYGDVIQNCFGIGPTYGIFATSSVTSSYGESTGGGNGIQSAGTVSFCRGKTVNGFAINCAIAIGCTTGGGNISSPEKHLGTP